MKIKLAILESDTVYLERISTTFGTRYSEQLELYCFTDEKLAMDTVNSAKIDVMLANESFEIQAELLPDDCAFAYLVDSVDIGSVRGQPVICRFQRAEMIYKQILSLYAETTDGILKADIDGSGAKLVLYASPCGGVGTSCVAAASAKRYAALHKKVLYLNLETFGSADLYFAGEGISDMSDVIYALKSKRSNLAMKLESCVKKSGDGVAFYGPAKLALDMLELTSEDVRALLKQLKMTGEYDYIVVDADFGLQGATLDIYDLCDALVWVSDGSESANHKILRAFQALTVMEQKGEHNLTSRVKLIYNRFSSKTGAEVAVEGMNVLGGAPVYAYASTQQVVEQLSAIGMFDNLV